MARRKRIPHPKLTKELRARILHRVQTWPWLSMVAKIPTPVIPTGGTPTQEYLNKYDPDYEERLALCEATLDMLDARGGVDWVAVADALDRGWAMEFAHGLGDMDRRREWLEDRDLVVKNMRDAVRRGRRNPYLAGSWVGHVEEYLRSEVATIDLPRRRPRAGQSRPWVKEIEKVLCVAGVPEEEAAAFVIALRLRRPRK